MTIILNRWDLLLCLLISDCNLFTEHVNACKYSCYLINKFKNSVGLTTFCPLQVFLGKCFLLPVIRTSAVDARAASRNGSSLLSGRSKDSAKEGAFIPFERMTSSMVWTFFRFRSNFGLFKTSRYSASICSLIMI